MLLTLSTTHKPATDLGFLLGRNPDRCHSVPIPSGHAHVFYPVVGESRCTAALLIELDPVRFVRDMRHRTHESTAIASYVNDRPFVASAMMSLAIARAFGSALAGESRDRPKLVDVALELEATLAAVRCSGGAEFVKRLFVPLGYDVEATRLPFDRQFEAWGESPYHRVRIRGRVKLRDLVTQLQILLPVLDDDESYEIGDESIRQFVARRDGFLRTHPERERIAACYAPSKHRWDSDLLARIVSDDDEDLAGRTLRDDLRTRSLESALDLDKVRIKSVTTVLRELDVRSVLDLGCGEGALLEALASEERIERLVGVDVASRVLALAAERLGVAFPAPPTPNPARIELLHGSITYRDARFSGFDAATLLEVVPRLEPAKLAAFERVVFEHARPRHVLLTMPNTDFNARSQGFVAGAKRHAEHRFEWSRAELEKWAKAVGSRFGYTPRFVPIGAKDGSGSSPTQMAVWSR